MATSPRSFQQVPVDEPLDVQAALAPEARRTHRKVAGVVVGLAAAAGCAAAWNGMAGCTPMTDAALGSVTSFAQEYPSEMLNIADRPGDEDAVSKWLSGASLAAKMARENSELREPVKVAQKAVERAMLEKDPVKAKAIIQQAMKNSVAETVARRKDLKSFVASQRRSLKAHHTNSPQQQAFTAQCVFDTLQATNSIAFIAANLNDAFMTCGHIKIETMLEKHNTHGKICAINVATAFSEIGNLAAMLSLAANDCAATLVPNVDALCAASISGLVYGVGNIGAGGALMAAACNHNFMGSEVPPDAVPSTVGSNAELSMSRLTKPGRRLQANATQAAPARQLLFGGGHASTGTQCGIEVTNILWAMAKAALAINFAANGNTGSMGKCPPSNLLGGHRIKGPVYKMGEAFCAQNVGGILVGYAQIIGFLQIAIVDCQDVLNLDAICGAGVAAMLGGFAAVTQAGSGVHLACDTFQDPLLKKALAAAAKIDGISGNRVSQVLGGGKLLGRRLSESSGREYPEGTVPPLEDALDMSDEELEKHFGSPQELFKKMGIDLEDKALREQRLPVPDVSRFFEQPSESAGATSQCAA